MKIPRWRPSPGTLRRTLSTLALGLVLAAAVLLPASRGGAVTLCGDQSQALMRKVGITGAQIARLCELSAQLDAILSLRLHRTAEELGYCRVTLALRNNSLDYINDVSLTTVNGRFEIFRFRDILPGSTGYASAKSRILLACDELDTVRLIFHWPASMRVADRSPQGRHLKLLKPVLLSRSLGWNR